MSGVSISAVTIIGLTGLAIVGWVYLCARWATPPTLMWRRAMHTKPSAWR